MKSKSTNWAKVNNNHVLTAILPLVGFVCKINRIYSISSHDKLAVVRSTLTDMPSDNLCLDSKRWQAVHSLTIVTQFFSVYCGVDLPPSTMKDSL